MRVTLRLMSLALLFIIAAPVQAAIIQNQTHFTLPTTNDPIAIAQIGDDWVSQVPYYVKRHPEWMGDYELKLQSNAADHHWSDVAISNPDVDADPFAFPVYGDATEHFSLAYDMISGEMSFSVGSTTLTSVYGAGYGFEDIYITAYCNPAADDWFEIDELAVNGTPIGAPSVQFDTWLTLTATDGEFSNGFTLSGTIDMHSSYGVPHGSQLMGEFYLGEAHHTVPEPTTIFLLGSSLLGLAFVSRKYLIHFDGSKK